MKRSPDGNDNAGPLLVLGAGSWGTALAAKARGAGGEVRIWGRDRICIQSIRDQDHNARYLADVPLPAGIVATDDLDEAMDGVRDVLVATPSGAFAAMLDAIDERIAQPRIAWACKGLERGSQRLLSEVVAARFGAHAPCATISGPTFAREVALNLPSAVVVAGNDAGLVGSLSRRLHQPNFRVYQSDDLVGVQVGGAAKNVLAIAAGIADGLGFGANTRAALIARGLAEMVRVAECLGARSGTLMGLAGLGDLVLTCTDDQSRNRRYGLAIGRGESPRALLTEGAVVEGAYASRELAALASALSIELPIASRVDQVVWHGLTPRDAVAELLARDPTSE